MCGLRGFRGHILRRTRAAARSSSMIRLRAAPASIPCLSRKARTAAARWSADMLRSFIVSSIAPCRRLHTASKAACARAAAVGSMPRAARDSGRVSGLVMAAATTRTSGATNGNDERVASPARARVTRAAWRNTGMGERAAPCRAPRSLSSPLLSDLPPRGGQEAVTVPVSCRSLGRDLVLGRAPPSRLSRECSRHPSP